MVHPHHADEPEADQKREVRGPLRQQSPRQRLRSGRNFDFENQERDRDRINTIGKRLDPRGLTLHRCFDEIARKRLQSNVKTARITEYERASGLPSLNRHFTTDRLSLAVSRLPVKWAASHPQSGRDL